MRARLWLLAALAVAAAFLVGPGLAGAGAPPATVSATGPDNETSTAWFVQLSGAPTADGGSASSVQSAQNAFFKNAAAMGVQVHQRQAFGTLWNGVSVNVPLAQAGSLMSIPGVTAVYPVRPVSLPPGETSSSTPADFGSNPMIGVDPANGGVGRFNGAGIRVAVIDSGIDYRNPDLGGCVGPRCRVLGGVDLVGNDYDDTPTDPTFQPTPHPSLDILPCDPNVADANVAKGDASNDAGHGTHVAGIIGAKAADANGVTGVAPGVQFLAFKVFGCNGSTDNDNIVHALELAFLAHAQVVNMSIGDDYASWPEEPTAKTSDLLSRLGVVVVAAEGNAGNPTNGNGPFTSALFSGGDPATGNSVIAVGSVDNTKLFLPYFQLADGSKYGYIQAAAAPAAPTSGSAPIVTVPDTIGCAAEAAGSLSGKIALIKRGTCTFNVKAVNAQNAGAVGVVLYNNNPPNSGYVNATVAGTTAVTIPVVGVDEVEGAAIAAAIAGGNGTLTWTPNTDFFANAPGGLISTFSSWGPTAELGLKPDVSAPGGFIRSTWPITQFGGHNVISGTSMASPHVAGAAAILLQAGVAPSEVRDRLSNSAVPVPWNAAPKSGLLDSPLRQGAGLIKVDASVAQTTLVQPAKLSLGEGNGGVQTLTIANNGDTPVTYSLSATSAIAPAPVSAGWPSAFGIDQGEDSVTFAPAHVTVRPHSRSAVTTSVSVDPSTPDGETYGGFITLTPSNGGSDITVPYAGYKGDYQAQPVLTSARAGLPWLAKLSADGKTFTQQAAGATYTLQGNDQPYIVYHLNIPARKLLVQIENADGSFVNPVHNVADTEEFLSRNSTPTSFFAFAWDGTRAQDNGNNKRKDVPNGTYMLKLSVLKPLGDANNAADWETFTTPAFTIARP